MRHWMNSFPSSDPPLFWRRGEAARGSSAHSQEAAMDEDLPAVPTSIEKEHPALWSAYAALGQAARQSGPLDARTCRLVHLALAMAANSEGATHSHVRRGLAEGLSGDELEHVALLAVTTLGWPQAMRALSWIRDLTRPEGD